jgi:hypothetical protein
MPACVVPKATHLEKQRLHKRQVQAHRNRAQKIQQQS